MKMKRFVWIVATMCVAVVSGSAFAGLWADSFDDGVVDLTNYQIVKNSTGSVDLDETTVPGALKVFTNSPGGSYALTAVKVQLGDTVRTTYQQASVWNTASVSAIGLAYTLDVTRLLDYTSAGFYLRNSYNDVRAWRSVDNTMTQQLTPLAGVGDPLEQTWIYEIKLGLDKGDGTFDATMSVYDAATGEKLGNSVTYTTKTETGNLYWYVGENRHQDYVYSVQIVPEPATLALLGFGGIVTFLRKKK